MSAQKINIVEVNSFAELQEKVPSKIMRDGRMVFELPTERLVIGPDFTAENKKIKLSVGQLFVQDRSNDNPLFKNCAVDIETSCYLIGKNTRISDTDLSISNHQPSMINDNFNYHNEGRRSTSYLSLHVNSDLTIGKNLNIDKASNNIEIVFNPRLQTHHTLGTAGNVAIKENSSINTTKFDAAYLNGFSMVGREHNFIVNGQAFFNDLQGKASVPFPIKPEPNSTVVSLTRAYNYRFIQNEHC